MRKLRFRAWDTELNKYQNENYCLQIKTGIVQGLYGQLFPEMILEQFTGLKDKNGKEIYEGDILDHVPYNIPRKVIFKDGSFCMDDGTSLNVMWIENTKHLEVIGNIHQNK